MDITGRKVRKRGFSAARLELIKKAASLSLEEYTVPEIAIQLKISDSKVRRQLAASEGLPTSYLTETAQVARLLDLHRLDGLLTVAPKSRPVLGSLCLIVISGCLVRKKVDGKSIERLSY